MFFFGVDSPNRFPPLWRQNMIPNDPNDLISSESPQGAKVDPGGPGLFEMFDQCTQIN